MLEEMEVMLEEMEVMLEEMEVMLEEMEVMLVVKVFVGAYSVMGKRLEKSLESGNWYRVRIRTDYVLLFCRNKLPDLVTSCRPGGIISGGNSWCEGFQLVLFPEDFQGGFYTIGVPPYHHLPSSNTR